MIVLAIWLFLLGYSIAITGKRNLGLSYRPQADGSIKAVDQKGTEARAYSLMDVITCAQASGQLQGQAAPPDPARPSLPTLPPVGKLRPQLLPIPLPGFARIPTPAPEPRGPLPRPPFPLPGGGLLGEIDAWERGIAEDVYNGINGIAGGLRDVFGGVHLPGLHWPIWRPQL